VIADISTLPGLERSPWKSRYIQGVVDVPYLNLTPGTRSGIVHDEHYAAFVDSLAKLEAHLIDLIDAQQRAEEEQANRESLRAIQRAFREAMLILPREEYDWFDIQSGPPDPGAGETLQRGVNPTDSNEEVASLSAAEPRGETSRQRRFFDYAGPLHTVVISPTTSTLAVKQSRRFRALPRDRSRRRVQEDLTFAWGIVEGDGKLLSTSDQEVSFEAIRIMSTAEANSGRLRRPDKSMKIAR
jgi:hypothetical protein